MAIWSGQRQRCISQELRKKPLCVVSIRVYDNRVRMRILLFGSTAMASAENPSWAKGAFDRIEYKERGVRGGVRLRMIFNRKLTETRRFIGRGNRRIKCCRSSLSGTLCPPNSLNEILPIDLIRKIIPQNCPSFVVLLPLAGRGLDSLTPGEK